MIKFASQLTADLDRRALGLEVRGEISAPEAGPAKRLKFSQASNESASGSGSQKKRADAPANDSNTLHLNDDSFLTQAKQPVAFT
ncbi:hypothetical protein [Verrucomicrobium spinosum]|uniref:hypothetical protein n=1 Tax=Verrucomicrobium spinosum TaxID=2736 RepID=UPI0012E2391D|nr:hypothetical protein [Verrucomicrobium spinosum]